MKKRFLLASMAVGGGHNALRDSFVQSMQEADPKGSTFEIVRFDSQDVKIPRFYEFAVHKAPWMQAMLYELGRLQAGPRVAVNLNGQLFREAKKALLDHAPDVVVCTHFLLSMMFAKARHELSREVTIVSAIPDYGETTEIFCPQAKDLQADHYVAMDPKTLEHLLSTEKVPSSRVHLGGFNPRQGFVDVGQALRDQRRLTVEERQTLRDSLLAEHPELQRLDVSKPTLVFLGGSAWTSKTLPVMEALLRREDYLASVNCIVVCGKNEAFTQTLRERGLMEHPRFSIFGFITPAVMAKLLALGDVPVLGSLAPASMHELMETKLGPLMLFHYIPGTEEPHVEYIREQQIGLYEPNPQSMLQNLMELTGFVRPGAEMSRLMESFPSRAEAIRQAHREAAAQFPRFLAKLGRVEALPLPGSALHPGVPETSGPRAHERAS